MLKLILFGLLAFGIANVATHLATPFAADAARAARVMDYPGGRRRHRGAVPRLGGLGIAVGLVLSTGAVALALWREWGAGIGRGELLAFALATGLVFLVGLADDVYGPPFWQRLAAEFMAAAVIVAAGWQFTVLGLPVVGTVHLGVLGPVITVLWIAGVTNAVNLIDGLDGLAAGIVAVIAASLMLYASVQHNVFTVLLMGAVAGACTGFLPWNLRGEVFMGDAGSLTLGFILAVMTVHSSLKAPAAVAILVPILALGVPVIDTLLVMLVRFVQAPRGKLARRALRMFRGDRNHIHHLLAEWAPNRKAVVWVMYAMVAASCAGAMVVVIGKSADVGLALVAAELVVIVLLRRAGYAARARQQAREQRREVREQMLGVAAPLRASADQGVLSFADREGGRQEVAKP